SKVEQAARTLLVNVLAACPTLYPFISLCLRPTQDAATAGIVPFLLYFVGMAVPDDVAALRVGSAKLPGALVSNLIANYVVPGVEVRIGCSFYLLVRGNVDGAIGIKVMVGAGRNTAGRQVRSGIRHGSILRVAAKGAVIGAEIAEAARTATANVLSFCCEDKEDIVDVRGPTLHLLGMRYFALYLSIRKSSRR